MQSKLEFLKKKKFIYWGGGRENQKQVPSMAEQYWSVSLSDKIFFESYSEVHSYTRQTDLVFLISSWLTPYRIPDTLEAMTE